jgi:hypothetical protein
MTKLLSLLALVGLLFTATPAFAATPLSAIEPGDLIRGQTFTAVYYMGRDGMRYVFPNDRTYFTWYANFDGVKWLTDADLAKIQIGGNVTYRPGVKMIKINSDPKTYAIDEGGTLRWVTSEAVAIGLYGSTWNKKIDDVPDAFFSNYKKGDAINAAADFVPATVTARVGNINEDKSLVLPVLVTVTDSGFSPADIHVLKGRPVKFVNNGSNKHAATSDDLAWGTGTLNSGDAFIRYFTARGESTFFDSYYPNLRGTVIVE